MKKIAKNEPYIQEFDALMSLARSDPDAFEQQRLDIIERYISQFPPERQQRLRSLQWRVEQERARAKTPLGACINIMGMMLEKVLAEDGLMDQLGNLSAILADNKPQQSVAPDAEILPFQTDKLLPSVESEP